jgi:hypothetical protein
VAVAGGSLVGAAELGGTEPGDAAAGADVLDGSTKVGPELGALGGAEQAPSAIESPRTTAEVLRRTW